MNNEFDDLDELERELGDTVRVALRRVAKTVADDQRPMGSGHGSSAGEVFLTVDAENTTKSRPPRNGMHLFAAGILAAASVAGIAVAVTRDGTPADAPNQTVAAAAAPPVQLTEHVLTALDSVEVTLSLPPGWDGDNWSCRHRDGRHRRRVHLGVGCHSRLFRSVPVGGHARGGRTDGR